MLDSEAEGPCLADSSDAVGEASASLSAQWMHNHSSESDIRQLELWWSSDDDTYYYYDVVELPSDSGGILAEVFDSEPF